MQVWLARYLTGIAAGGYAVADRPKTSMAAQRCLRATPAQQQALQRQRL